MRFRRQRRHECSGGARDMPARSLEAMTSADVEAFRHYQIIMMRCVCRRGYFHVDAFFPSVCSDMMARFPRFTFYQLSSGRYAYWQR